MGRKFLAFMIIGLCVCFGGCASDASLKDAEKDGAFEGRFFGNPVVLSGLKWGGADSLAEAEAEIMEGGGSYDKRDRTVEVLTSWEDWTAVSEKIIESDRQWVRYDKGFFKEKDLLFIKFVAEGYNQYSLEQMDVTDGKLNITIAEKTWESHASGWYKHSLACQYKTGLLVELEKGSVPKDVRWGIHMEEGVYYRDEGYIRGMRRSDGKLKVEFEAVQWVANETRPDDVQYVSLGEAKTYAAAKQARYFIDAENMEQYNQHHEKKLEGAQSWDLQGNEVFLLDEPQFIDYIEYVERTGGLDNTIFHVSTDNEEVVEIDVY